MSYNDLVQVLTWLLTNRIQQKIDYTHGLLGDGNGRVRVSTKPGDPEVDYVYVRPDRFSDRAFKIFNKRVSGQDGDPVIVGELPWEPGLIQVIDLDWQTYQNVGWGDDVTTVNRHGQTHQWRDGAPGLDTFNVYRRQLGDLKTYAGVSGTLSVGVSPYSLTINEKQYQWPGVQDFSLSDALPAGTGTARMALVYWDITATGTAGSLGVATGTLGSSADPVLLDRPSAPAGTLPSAFIRLKGGQSSITESDIWDAKEPFRPDSSALSQFKEKLVTPDIPEPDYVDLYFVSGSVDSGIPYTLDDTGKVRRAAMLEVANVFTENQTIFGTGTAARFYFQNTATGQTELDGLEVSIDSTGSNAFIWFRETGTLQFATTDTLRMLIDQAGKVQIFGALETDGERIVSTETYTDTSAMSDTIEEAVCNKATAFTLTLPAHKTDKRIRIINIGAGVVTLSPTSGTIQGGSATLNQWESVILLSDGTNWL